MTRFVLVALAAALLYAPTVRHRNLLDCGGSSRMATAESLVERGTFVIDGSTFAYTCDVFTKDGRLYSDKPPVLSVVAAGIYGVLHATLGLRFNPDSDPRRNAVHDHTYALLTFLVVVVAQALLVASVDAAGGDLGLAAAPRLLATAAVAVATPLWSLTAIFNSHSVAAALLFAGFRDVCLRASPRPRAAGLWLGLATAVDLPLGLLALLVVALATRRPVALAMGALAPIALHAALNWHLVGDLVPFQMHRELYTEATGHTGSSATGFAQDAGLAFYAARNLLGSLGVFSLTPLLVLAVALGLRVARSAGGAALPAAPPGRAGAPPAPRMAAVVALALFAACCALYVVVWPEAVGCAYGMRHVAPAIPPLLLVAAAGLRSARERGVYLALGLGSTVLAAGGLLSPTTCAGFRKDAGALVPARVFIENLRDELRPRLGLR